MKKNMKLLLLIIGCFMLHISLSEANAQSKKKLKQENATLKSENEDLRKAKLQIEERANEFEKRANELESENQRLSSEVSALNTKVLRLEGEKTALDNQLGEMEDEYDSLKRLGTSGGQVYKVSPNDNRTCARRQGQLQADKSYFVDLNSQVISHGWGLQVYSSNSLCKAQDKAKDFESYYHMYKTYIKVKNVDGQPLYCVVYGSLKYKDQAKVYCDNFRKIGRNEGERNAFLVQH
ncbi:hypothetical protein V6R21_22135 [Limibacter armeniacum]|uniref:hypothetical protein n=1 Tax=Limibacter armeniacum TaxID=466084 RepID=UPI002FE51449